MGLFFTSTSTSVPTTVLLIYHQSTGRIAPNPAPSIIVVHMSNQSSYCKLISLFSEIRERIQTYLNYEINTVL